MGIRIFGFPCEIKEIYQPKKVWFAYYLFFLQKKPYLKFFVLIAMEELAR